ncbi:MAG: hypothetical protein HPY89_10230 [Pelotomaculum sp.]|nr:hypothetical protein [Pelotomaculum sp.]
MDEGKKYMDKGDFQKAKFFYAKALKLEDSAPARNNLATAVFLGQDPQRALRILAPVLKALHFFRIYCSNHAGSRRPAGPPPGF